MDYMQEISRRQQKALTALLLGRGEEQAEGIQRTVEPVEQDPVAETAASVEKAYAELGTEAGTPEGKAADILRAQAEERSLLRRTQADGSDSGSADSRQESWLGRQAEEYHLYRSADALWREENTSGVTQQMSIFRTSAVAEIWDAAAMSRIFQRDARRYDGSFRTD